METEKSMITRPQSLPVPVGTVLTKFYQGQKYEVTQRQDGLEFDGRIWPSLTAIALAITGKRTGVNGRLFFGVSERSNAPRMPGGAHSIPLTDDPELAAAAEELKAARAAYDAKVEAKKREREVARLREMVKLAQQAADIAFERLNKAQADLDAHLAQHNQ